MAIGTACMCDRLGALQSTAERAVWKNALENCAAEPGLVWSHARRPSPVLCVKAASGSDAPFAQQSHKQQAKLSIFQGTHRAGQRTVVNAVVRDFRAVKHAARATPLMGRRHLLTFFPALQDCSPGQYASDKVGEVWRYVSIRRDGFGAGGAV